jgi:hypothetical protein
VSLLSGGVVSNCSMFCELAKRSLVSSYGMFCELAKRFFCEQLQHVL